MDLESLSCPSVCLSWLLDKIIGTEEDVTMRRMRDSMFHYTMAFTEVQVFYSGSRGEGLEFKSSDRDFMLISKYATVLNSIQDKEIIDKRGDKSKTLLLMRREGCNAGFVILQLLSPLSMLQDDHISNSLVDYNNLLVLSSLLFRDSFIQKFTSELIKTDPFEAHGPCATGHIVGKEVDMAYCFACNTWPSEAYSFIHRKRPCGWPSKALIDRIIQNGCHVVAIGDTNSDISHIQWRLSFSAAEKMLVNSFNHTQLKVYALLKIFLKQAINTEVIVKDLLCSYFLKTAVFYVIETTPQLSWREDRLIPCFWFCFNKLIEWVEQGYCPNYFVPQNNMFRSKVYGERRQALLCVLNGYRRQGWTCLYRCTDLKPLKLSVIHPQAAYHLLPKNEIEMELLLDKELHYQQPLSSFTKYEETLRQIGSSSNMLRYSRSRMEEGKAYHYLCESLIGFAQFQMSGLTSKSKVSHNKSSYSLVKKCERVMNASVQTDICSRYLSKATFYYAVGNYRKTLQSCEQMILHYRPFVAYYGFKSEHIPDSYQHYVCGRNLSIRVKVTMATVQDFALYDDHKPFYPHELHRDIQLADTPVLFIPPLPYATFLAFLCHHQLGNIRSSLYALRDLRMLVDDEYQGCRKYPIVLNLLAICLQKVGDVHGAIQACLKSMKLQPNKNGASEILDKLLRSR